MSRPETTGRRFIGTRAVSERYGVSMRAIERWIKAGAFPGPDCYIQRRKFWDLETLDRLDRARVVEHAAEISAIGNEAVK